MVKTVAVVYPLNHKAQPNQCAIEVEWGTIGLRYEGLPNIFVTSINESLKGKNLKPTWSIKMVKIISNMIKMILWKMRLMIA